MNLLLHSCCAPCTTYCLEKLRSDGHDVYGYFYNPNIHPYVEFRRRLDTYRDYCASVGLDADICESYGLRQYIVEVGSDIDGRCAVCYRMRLLSAAKLALEKGVDAFTTTLSISPYQNHELLARVGEDVSREVGVPFIYYDFRPGYRRSVEISRELGLYRQPYCGCIFSEEERYSPKFRKSRKRTKKGSADKE
ncbi:MAG: epoxyqueuosine reductase QueH [Bacillota bacterium]|nr:epoxyqueuosine reductase QueH [Bacillota bacterium]HOB42731.1 epoxyqueuosine reductase QueH [Bacillota bacterium]HOK69918.1 epoxyqueuosine reductase QueH [Bacillota bacterium]HOL52357.1 epoxyqueuosine reductase QueH [Bacillota bacterium]HOO30726.1 epoxyqueuosine reductase QueH [Bacillota bacterium]